MKKLIVFSVCLCVISLSAQAYVVEKFSGDLSQWTSTVILDNSNPSVHNTASWQINNGALQLVTTFVDGSSVEQYAMIRSGLALGVGEEIQVDINRTTATGLQDIGLYVGGTTPTFNVRQNYVNVYARNNGQVYSRGFDGTAEYALAGGSSPTYSKLFIARTATNTFQAGYYDTAGVRNIISTRTPATANAATVVGIFADVRAVGTLGNADNLTLINSALDTHTPTPANGATGVALNTTLSWYTAVDPNNMSVPNPAVTKHYVYIREGDPNLKYVTPAIVSAGSPVNATASCNPPITLLADKIYYWRVDESINDSPAAGENTLVGPAWKFDAVKSIPTIVTQPSDTAAAVGETAAFSVSATVVGTMHYSWYYSTDATIGSDTQKGTDADTLTINPVAVTDEGYYYCKLVKVGNEANPVYTNVVKLGVKRAVAHWTLDGLVSGQYADSSGEGHHADPNGAPVFSTGAVGNGVTIDTANGWASAGTWNPSDYTGQFTVELWAKWTGQTTPVTWQGLVSKETSYGTGNMMWQLEINNFTPYQVVLKNGLETGNLATAALPAGSWEHIAITFNGATATVYRNGLPAASGTWSMGTKTDAPVNIGISAITLTQNLMFNGMLDDVKIYNYAISNTQVVDDYYAVSGTPVCILTYESKFDVTGPTDNVPDCVVDIRDFAKFAATWLDCGLYPTCQ
jgi:hypothetical protein